MLQITCQFPVVSFLTPDHAFLDEKTDRMIYNAITAAPPGMRRNTRRTAESNRKQKRNLLSAHFRLLNFRENIGISLVMSNPMTTTPARIAYP